MRYAQSTLVSSERSKAEIERILSRYGAESFMYGFKEDKAVIGFKMSNRLIRFELPMPDKKADEFWKTPTGRRTRNEYQAASAWEKASRQRWRALALVIKAKLEAVESGISEFEQEFMANIVLPDGKTVGEHLKPQIESAYGSGKMPKLLTLG